VLLNTYYCEMPTLWRPEAIWLFSTPVIRSIARPMSRNPGYARAGEYDGLMPVTEIGHRTRRAFSFVCRSHRQGRETLPLTSAGSHGGVFPVSTPETK
jgi:hypothetical protein